MVEERLGGRGVSVIQLEGQSGVPMAAFGQLTTVVVTAVSPVHGLVNVLPAFEALQLGEAAHLDSLQDSEKGQEVSLMLDDEGA